MSLDQDTINNQLTLLAAHRRTLAHLLIQQAQFSVGHIPAHIANGIAEARANINHTKAYLRNNGVQIADEPNDEAGFSVEGRVAGSANNSGGKQAWIVAVIVPIVVAAIGAYATIRAAQEARQSGEATPVAQLQPTIAAAQAAVDTQQAVLTPTPDTTPADTILAVGQTWKQGDTELTLSDATIQTGGIQLTFTLTNQKQNDISVQFTPKDNILGFDNRERPLNTCYPRMACPPRDDRTEKFVVPPGGSITTKPYVQVDTGRQDVTAVIVKIVNVSTITEAKWRIPIEH